MRAVRLATRSWLVVVLVVMLFTAALPWGSMAMLAPADEAVGSDSISKSRVADLRTLQRVLENKIVQQRLHDLGFTDEQINSRVNQLSDAQLHQVASQINTLFPGGDDGVIWTIVGILLIVVLVVILAILL